MHSSWICFRLHVNLNELIALWGRVRTARHPVFRQWVQSDWGCGMSAIHAYLNTTYAPRCGKELKHSEKKFLFSATLLYTDTVHKFYLQNVGISKKELHWNV
jgi:hypothetical protein